ncbi:hypothetical protein N7533_007102, partial [Penicillium manginii]|uniref:uncharacterized protein n=1 Tax=Penicillium manginii TaxID=203109 RepID=UPI00254890E9
WGYAKSYVGVFKAPEVERPPRDRWSKPSEPINNREHLPEGWHDEEPDLDPNDTEAHIARCHERIADDIIPVIFEHKLKTLISQTAKEE